MSIVKVQGNASGTGIFTVASPNSNTDRTLTLPDATGTVQVSGQPVSATTGTFSGTISGGSTIGVGGATPSASGAGITFPATQSTSTNANTLDDYEEGTWTPTAAITYATGTISTSSSSGWYTKVGNQITCWFNVVFTITWSGGTGNIGLTGLPFGAGSATQTGGCFGTARRQDQGGIIFQIESINSGATVGVLRPYDNGAISSASNVQISGFFTYQQA